MFVVYYTIQVLSSIYFLANIKQFFPHFLVLKMPIFSLFSTIASSFAISTEMTYFFAKIFPVLGSIAFALFKPSNPSPNLGKAIEKSRFSVKSYFYFSF